MLRARDLRYLKASQVKLAQMAEWVLGALVLVFFVLGVRNLHLASMLANEQGTSLATILTKGFQVQAHYPGQFLFTLERVNSGFLQLLIGALLTVTLYLAVTVRLRNGRLLEFVESHLDPGQIDPIVKS